MPPTAMHTGAHVPILNALLRELARTWREAPELAERCDVDNMRFFLGAAVVGACGDRVGDADPELMAVGGPEELKAYGDAALRDTSDNVLGVIIDIHPEWVGDGEGYWRVRAEAGDGGDGAAAGNPVLRDYNTQLTQAPTATRELGYLVQLLRDSAYSQLEMSHKTRQLDQLVLLALHQFENTTSSSAMRGDYPGFVTADAARRPGRVDSGDCELLSSTPHPALMVTSAARCVRRTHGVLSQPRGGGRPSEREPRGRPCPAHRRASGTKDCKSRIILYF